MSRLQATLTAVALLAAESTNVEAQGLRDVKPPVAFPSYLPLIIGFTAFIVLVALAVYLFRLRRIKKSDVPKPALCPWEKALKQLEALDKDNLLAKELYDRYYSVLSDILRHYIEEQLHIRAPEMTTEEFLQYLRTSAELKANQKEALQDFLESSDLVKFAKYAPDPAEAKQSFELAKQFISETRPKEVVGGP